MPGGWLRMAKPCASSNRLLVAVRMYLRRDCTLTASRLASIFPPLRGELIDVTENDGRARCCGNDFIRTGSAGAKLHQCADRRNLRRLLSARRRHRKNPQRQDSECEDAGAG